MGLRILFDESTYEQYQKEQSAAKTNGNGWPTDTWFQKRLRYLREQQRKKIVEGDIIYRCALGTIIVRQANAED
ncbi:MAG TPA: hypothetical protein VNL14_23535 [Candidatus Acidoferrales bacterium]|nr:hypothetical protein [Candidatus Acidoferrales bacterium]